MKYSEKISETELKYMLRSATVFDTVNSSQKLGMWRSQPKSACGFHMKNLSDADADLSPDQNLLVPAIITTAIQLSYFCVCL